MSVPTTPDMNRFVTIDACWICGGTSLVPVHRLLFELSEYARQDKELAAYSGETLALVRCRECGFSQPEALPRLPGFFSRLYDQRWPADWVEHEFVSGYKDMIFRQVLDGLARRRATASHRLLDIGAHVGRLVYLAGVAGWSPEGIELNPTTGDFARMRTGFPIHHCDLAELAARDKRFDAVTMIDVLEHIPDPVPVLANARSLLEPGGWIAVKVPHGGNQRRKEGLRARLRPGYRATLADNLVHVNHFTAATLARALRSAGYVKITVSSAAPELQPGSHGTVLQRTRRVLTNATRLAVHGVTRAADMRSAAPWALHLLAFGQRPA